MKKPVVYFFLLIGFSMAACNKNECYECFKEGNNPPTEQFCEKDFQDYQRFKQQIQVYEIAGWECKKIK